jgi:hypothetical protein
MWKWSFISINSDEDFYIEFTADTPNNANSIVALDDIEIKRLEDCFGK